MSSTNVLGAVPSSITTIGMLSSTAMLVLGNFMDSMKSSLGRSFQNSDGTSITLFPQVCSPPATTLQWNVQALQWNSAQVLRPRRRWYLIVPFQLRIWEHRIRCFAENNTIPCQVFSYWSQCGYQYLLRKIFLFQHFLQMVPSDPFSSRQVSLLQMP